MNINISKSSLTRATLLVSIGLMLNGCTLREDMFNPQTPPDIAKANVVSLLDRYERACIGRDAGTNPHPARGLTVHRGFRDIVGSEISDGCTFWHWEPGRFGGYNREFVTYQQHNFFLSEIKRRFGVIYHGIADSYTGYCAVGKVHTMLLRDTETILTVIFARQDHSAFGCTENFDQGYAVQLRKFQSLIGRDNDPEPHLLTRLAVLNIDRLTDDEKLELLNAWDDKPDQDKEKMSREIADIMDTIRSRNRYMFEQYQSGLESDRQTRQFLAAKRQESRDSFNRMFTQAVTAAYSAPLASSGNISSSGDRQSSRPPVTPFAFKDEKGFNVNQLAESIDRSRLSAVTTNSPQSAAQESRAASADTGTTTSVTSAVITSQVKSKIYEPTPETVRGTNDTWFNERARALAYARLKAVNQISALCRNKNAQLDAPGFTEISTGNAPARWSYSAPNCWQGGFNGQEWKCEAQVSGTCYRMQ